MTFVCVLDRNAASELVVLGKLRGHIGFDRSVPARTMECGSEVRKHVAAKTRREQTVSGEKDPKVTVDIGLGAKASLEVSTEIPAQSTGRLLDALTDIIRPFSERRGLKANQIRLQREEVAIEIARRARHRLEIEHQPINPLPNKFLVSFLERASLEELDSVLIDRWADLLASCSADPTSAHPIFVSILSTMTGKDALLLRAIAFNGMDEEKSPNTALLGWDYDPRNARHELAEWLKDNEQTIGVEYDEENAPNVDNIYAHIIDTFGHPGVSL